MTVLIRRVKACMPLQSQVKTVLVAVELERTPSARSTAPRISDCLGTFKAVQPPKLH